MSCDYKDFSKDRLCSLLSKRSGVAVTAAKTKTLKSSGHQEPHQETRRRLVEPHWHPDLQLPAPPPRFRSLCVLSLFIAPPLTAQTAQPSLPAVPCYHRLLAPPTHFTPVHARRLIIIYTFKVKRARWLQDCVDKHRNWLVFANASSRLLGHSLKNSGNSSAVTVKWREKRNPAGCSQQVHLIPS